MNKKRRPIRSTHLALSALPIGITGLACSAQDPQADSDLGQDIRQDTMRILVGENGKVSCYEQAITAAERAEMHARDLAFVEEHNEIRSASSSDLNRFLAEHPEQLDEDHSHAVDIGPCEPFDSQNARRQLGDDVGQKTQALLVTACEDLVYYAKWTKIYTGTNYTGNVVCLTKFDQYDYHFDIPSHWALHPSNTGIHSLIIQNLESPGVWSRDVNPGTHYAGWYGSGGVADLGSTWLHDGIHDFTVACW